MGVADGQVQPGLVSCCTSWWPFCTNPSRQGAFPRHDHHLCPDSDGLSLNSAAGRNISYDSLFTATELNAVKPWLIRPARATVGLSLCSAAIHVVSDAFPSTALELSALKP